MALKSGDTAKQLSYFERLSTKTIAIALTDTPVVMVIGPRQCGKTTLVRQFESADREYIALDEETVLQAARSDPTGFIRGFNRVIIDEIQRATEILRAIKYAVDSSHSARLALVA